METPFPFGFPLPTGFYLTLYVATWVIHAAFMNYVLAGSAYLGAAIVIQGKSVETNPLASLLRDWLPFMLSAAITAGIAPLLFVQILYEDSFYTANQLLFHRWMAILPTLMLGFYLLYLLKAKFIAKRSLKLRIAIGISAFLCFAFVAWSWTENHLLSLQPQSVWVEQYASGVFRYRDSQLISRLSLWFASSFPTMATVLAWQLMTQKPTDLEKGQPGTRRTAALAMCGLVASGAAAGIYLNSLDSSVSKSLFSALGFPYLMLASLGLVIQLLCWISIYARSKLDKISLAIASTGLCCTLTGFSVSREVIRISTIDWQNRLSAHESAFRVGGFALFLTSAVVCGGLIFYVIRLVRKNLTESSASHG